MIVKCSINQEIINAKVKKDNNIPDGMAGLFILPGKPYLELPAWGKFSV
jgi:hypothetical protein